LYHFFVHKMTIYSIIRQSKGLLACQTPAAPKTLFAVSIKPFVPAVFHPFVLWTQLVPPLQENSLVVRSNDGTNVYLWLHGIQKKIMFLNGKDVQLSVDLSGDFEKLMSTVRVYHLYALGEECVDRIYNAHQYKCSTRSHAFDLEDSREMK